MVFLLVFLSLALYGQPIKVPQEFYSGFAKVGNHPGNAPFITDKSFRSISDHIIDQGTEWFDPATVRQGDIIYLNLWYLEWFEAKVHDEIPCPYILLTCDVGDWYPDPRYQRLLYDPKLTTWFCRNIVFSYHPKVIQIPMGQNDRNFSEFPLGYLKKLLLKKPYQKEHLLYMSFFPRAIGDRDQIYKLFENEPYCFSRIHTNGGYTPVVRWDYFDEVVASYFTLSPYGLETDCIRTWEALALDCVPIVEHTFLDPLFEGLPVVMVHDWTEINEEFLKQRKELFNFKKLDKAYFEYWHQIVKERQNKVRNNDLSFAEPEATQLSPQDLSDLLDIIQTTSHSSLIYRGFHTAVHALQVASAPFLSKIQVYDPWASQKEVCSFVTNPSLLKNQKKVSFHSFKTFDTLFSAQASNCYPIFFDFSYYRNSLMRDPTLKKFRHSLKKDLADLYNAAYPSTLFCGNMIENEYVREVLDKLSKELNLPIQTKGRFWFFIK